MGARRRSIASPNRSSHPETAPPGPPPIALVLIDDNRLLREGLTAMIHTQPGFKVLAASADANEALQKVREAKPDVVLLDFGLEDHDSLSLTVTVRAEVPSARVIVMGLLPLQEDVADYVRAGASGFIMKDASFDDFFATIRAVAAGGEVLPQALTNSPLQPDRPERAYERQGEGAGCRSPHQAGARGHRPARGRLSNKEIATRLDIAVHTVKSHVHNVLEKLALHSRLEVAAFSHSGSAPGKRQA